MAGNSAENNGAEGFGVNGNLEHGHNWVPGRSGNPSGRPKGAKTGVRARLRALLAQHPTEQAVRKAKETGLNFDEGTVADLIAARLAFEASNGDTTAINTVFKQTELPVELDDGDNPEGGRSNTLSPNAREIAQALDRE
jgi:hypothetical protein